LCSLNEINNFSLLELGMLNLQTAFTNVMKRAKPAQAVVGVISNDINLKSFPFFRLRVAFS
jgi:hypothetical protein